MPFVDTLYLHICGTFLVLLLRSYEFTLNRYEFIKYIDHVLQSKQIKKKIPQIINTQTTLVYKLSEPKQVLTDYFFFTYKLRSQNS